MIVARNLLLGLLVLAIVFAFLRAIISGLQERTRVRREIARIRDASCESRGFNVVTLPQATDAPRRKEGRLP